MTKEICIGADCFNIKAILFDKDGTLIDLTSLHVPLLQRRAHAISKICQMDIYEDILQVWGYNSKKQLFDIRGPAIALAKEQEKILAASILYGKGLPWKKALQTVELSFVQDEGYNNSPEWISPISGALDFVIQARNAGLKLGIVTGDTQHRAIEASKVLQIFDQFEFIIGVDNVVNDKPAPDLILAFVENTKISPDHIMVIGDSTRDMMMGKSARVAACIGVLTGEAEECELQCFADAVINNLSDITIKLEG